MNPNLNNPSGILHHHHPSSSAAQQLQPSIHPPLGHPAHHNTHLTPAATASHPAAAHPHHLQHHPSDLANPSARSGDPVVDQQQQRSNIEHYKSSATPAYDGYIGSTHDALIIFSGCYLGHFPMVSRRLHERERRSIRSGAVYVFDETKAGIKRWTDGRVWSPSRILNNFLVYREIDQKRPPASSSANTNTASNNNNNNNNTNNINSSNNTASTSTTTNTITSHNNATSTSSSNNNTSNNNSIALKHEQAGSHHSKSSLINQQSTSSRPPANVSSSQPHSASSQYNSSRQYSNTLQSNDKRESNEHSSSPLHSKPNIAKDENPTQSTSSENQSLQPAPTQRPINRERERSLVGSLTSTYKFRPDGLVKKTISIAGMHMISYYKLDDVVSGRLRAPTSHVTMLHLNIVPHLLNAGYFRNPPIWGYSNGRFWIQEEGPEESSQITSSTSPSSVTNSSASLRPAATLPALPSSTSSNPTQAIRSSHPPTRPSQHSSERIQPNSAISRPGSPGSSRGSPNGTSPTSPHLFSLIPSSNHSSSVAAPNSPAINSHVAGRPNYSSCVHNNNNNSGSTPSVSSSSHLGRSPTIGGASSNRYEPYSRPNRSPPLSTPSTSNSTLTDQQNSVAYYSPSHTTTGLNYSTHTFLHDSHSTSLVGSDQQPTNHQNTHHDASAHEGRSLESVHQVGGYDDTGAYRAATSTSGGGESLYAHYGVSDPTHSSHRSSSVPPPSYGLPSINRLGGGGQQPAGSSTSTSGRGIGDYFSGSPSQSQVNRLAPSAARPGATYGGYLSPAVAENAFRATSSGGSSLAERDNNNTYGASSHSTSGQQGSPTSGTTSSPSFLYPSSSASTHPSSGGYAFSSAPSRRGSGIAALTGDIASSNPEAGRPGVRISTQNRANGGGLQLNENNNGASHWAQISSTHVMKKEEGGGG
ncbi:hypothetical protein PCANC_00580 [Puccinia coronata f. sp. avenae]|uniref:Uncharacterized protein n=1 Tax=Puccinia coronata f. sp. avenae TaxID=200324 RepID=A0A2N5W852_9BASI|nr:hypothetical protein PCANC_00580 [Puccinia coronata f. sp. avenae]